MKYTLDFLFSYPRVDIFYFQLRPRYNMTMNYQLHHSKQLLYHCTFFLDLPSIHGSTTPPPT